MPWLLPVTPVTLFLLSDRAFSGVSPRRRGTLYRLPHSGSPIPILRSIPLRLTVTDPAGRMAGDLLFDYRATSSRKECGYLP